MVQTSEVVFKKEIKGLGEISIRPINLENDIDMLYSWVSKPYAKYWGMLEQTKEEVFNEYKKLEDNSHHHTYIGELNKQPIFLMERYKTSEDVIVKHYDALDNDYGMHILVAPAEKKIPKFTWHVFSTVMAYFFSLPFVNRVVVEPDINNEKIHVLNKKAGFVYQKNINLDHKIASLAFCTKEAFYQSVL
ncbi:acetyltransferase [Cellulophaga baltica]|uniref:GNAT family N-acetyltransferase n=1 Tax=Cellulophaga TaxID=104264 RepID=UPI001C06A040|nr:MULTISPECIES: GNAT family N-acetyltransferase [Cellulophaga]MBU2996781.1 acetyltransferase [Cellulophaga baltica]MDO6768177.1 GNAT family N-acetyltransferase [Cellulophaga sp. 1_MG-2023]